MNIYETNPNTVDYYIVYIFILAIMYSVIILIQNFLKNRNEELNRMNVTLDYYGAKMGTQVVHDVLTKEQRAIRFKFLFVSVLVKAATWVKAPYIFALYNRVHGFTRGEIGILKAADNVSALILGPLFSGLADMYGRKKFCIVYCLAIIVHVGLRVTGSKPLAWLAEIVTGICSALLDNVFESWLNFEANFLFPGLEEDTAKKMKNSYLREIFTKQVTLDCFCSIVLTGVATYLYAQYNIFYPFYACIFLAILAALSIAFFWEENRMDRLDPQDKHAKQYTFMETFHFAWNRLKSDKALMCVGVIESCFKICLVLFLFVWTPLLEETIGTFIHPGAIFACFMLARLIGSEFFDLMKQLLATNSYFVSVFVTVTGTACFIFAYHIFEFNTRLILFTYFDGLSGIFSPLFSSLRAQMIPEKYRSTIMSFFKIPINLCSIVCLFGTSYLTTYQICLMCAAIMLVAAILNIYLFFVHSPPDMEKRQLKKTSEFMSLYERSKLAVENQYFVRKDNKNY